MMSLKSRAAKAVSWQLFGSITDQTINFAFTILLARLLEPSDFGLMAMAMFLIALSRVFIDVGFSSAIIQNQNNTDLTYSSVFYFNLTLGLAFTLIFYFSADMLGRIYGLPQVSEIFKWLSALFLFNAANSVQQTILKKRLDFKKISVRTNVAHLFGGIVGVTSAFMGYGVYSLVSQSLASSVASTIVLWSASGWRPDFNFSVKEIKKLSGFSLYVFLDNLTNQLSNKLDVFVIGKWVSPAALGLLTTARKVNNTVNVYTVSSYMNVMYPLLSEVRSDQKQFLRVYSKLISVTTFLSMLAAGIIYILSSDVIMLLFGEKWIDSVDMLQVLALSISFSPINTLSNKVFLSMGLSKQNFKIGLVKKYLKLLPLVTLINGNILDYLLWLLAVKFCIAALNIITLKRYIDIPMHINIGAIIHGLIPLTVWVYCYITLDISYSHIFVRIGFAISYILFFLTFNYLIKNEGYRFLYTNVAALFKRMKGLK
ncbi:MAG: lipopolysaccharide biosynthesis protein [Cyclobacteriaceae bacterium]